MDFLKNLTAFLPLGKKEEKLEYFFATNIGAEKLTAALWTIEGKELKVLGVASQDYASSGEIISVTDGLLDQVLGLKEVEPQKILFGVPDSWLSDDNLKDEYLKILRSVVKELELVPMAYVATSHALIHFLERQEGVPTTAILVGFDKQHLTITVVRAGKLDGVKVVDRGEFTGSDKDRDSNPRCARMIEKALTTFTEVETLPSKILIYGPDALEFKSQLLSFSWMSKLSFLHFPKIEVLGDDIEIKSVCLAGGSEISEGVLYVDKPIKTPTQNKITLEDAKEVIKKDVDSEKEGEPKTSESAQNNFGFVVGDVTSQIRSDRSDRSEDQNIDESEEHQIDTEEFAGEEETEEGLVASERHPEIDDFEKDLSPSSVPLTKEHKGKFSFKEVIIKNFTAFFILFGVLSVIALLIGAYLFLLKADVKVFVEPKTLEKDAQVIADPNQKTVNDEGKIIPGTVVDVEVSGSAKDTATGKKQIGDPAKGTVIIRNKTDSAVALSKGTIFSSSSGLKFNLDLSVTVASRSADDGTWGKATGTATATDIGADGNLSSGSDFAIVGYPTDKAVAKSEGNFTGGTSKQVTVVSSEDTQRLLAKLSSDLRKQAQQKLQDKYPNKKILEEALSENIARKSYNKNINDQANEFSLDMTVKFKGTAFDDADLKAIVAKLVTTQVPDDFKLDLTETETQADVSKLEKDGKLVFLAKFKAKLIPKIDTSKLKNQIKFKTPSEAANLLKGMENVLGSEIKMTPSLPGILSRLPLLAKNITIEVGLK